MARACTVIGGILVVLGVAVALSFLVAIQRDDAYAKAAMASARNPGNVMYEAEFGKARLQRAFEVVGAAFGVLITLNGATLVGLGLVAARHAPQSQPRD